MQPGSRRWIFRLAAVALSTVLGLAVAEGLVRVLYPVDLTVVRSEHVRLSENPLLMYELDPDFEGHNSLGFRDEEFSPVRGQGVYRILALGDSVTYGNGVALDEAYPQQLERVLNASDEFRPEGETVEVLNMGVPGYSILQELEQLRSVGLAFEPDLVVLLVCLNDGIPHTVEFDQLLATRQGEAIGFLSSFYDPAHGWLRRLLYRSHLVRLISFNLHQMEVARTQAAWTQVIQKEGELPKVRDTSVKRFYDERAFFEANFRELSALLRQAGIPLVVALVPVKGTQHWNWYQRYRKMMQRLVGETGDPFVDFLAHLNGEYAGDVSFHEDVFLSGGDLFHLNPKGGGLLAEALLPALVRARAGEAPVRGPDDAPDEFSR